MTRTQSTFQIDKNTNTFADELLVAGFIRVLEETYDQLNIHPTITQIDKGQYYLLECMLNLDIELVETEIKAFYPAPILRTVKNAEKLPENLPLSNYVVIDYEGEKEKRTQYFEAYTPLDKTTKQAIRRGEPHPVLETLPPAPHEHWDIFRLLNPAALIGYNSLMLQWWHITQAQQTGSVICLLCELFSQSPNDFENAEKTWKALAKEHNWQLNQATASQFFNPSQGKGINKVLPNGVGLGNLKNFWLLEWLKAIGLYEIGFTRTVKGSKDRKTYVPVFGRMTPEFAQKVYSTFQKKMFSESAISSDILMIIGYLKAFLENAEKTRIEEANNQTIQLWNLVDDQWSPRDFIRGFQVAYYKDLGNAVTTMNLSFFNLPAWVKIKQPEDNQTYQDILTEHEEIVRQFVENKGDEITLLSLYRDFIVADNLDPFFEFTTAYSSYLISQGEKTGFPPRKFTTNNLRRMLMSNDQSLSHILNSAGFINIAYAIRQSTVTAQYRKKQNDRRYDVRYGLGRDLVRHSQYPTEFLAALSDFLHKYNAENAQVMENRPGPYRRSVQTSDIADIMQLVDRYGSDLVAKLLVAYGYARDPRPNNDESPVEE